MKRLVVLVLFVFVAIAAWQIGSRLSADAVGLATGVVFGVLAGLPTAILVLASSRNRRGEGDEPNRSNGANGAYPYGGYPQQPPVIVLAGAPQQMVQTPEPERKDPDRFDAARALPPPVEEPRRFRIVGDSGEMIEDDYVTL